MGFSSRYDDVTTTANSNKKIRLSGTVLHPTRLSTLIKNYSIQETIITLPEFVWIFK